MGRKNRRPGGKKHKKGKKSPQVQSGSSSNESRTGSGSQKKNHSKKNNKLRWGNRSHLNAEVARDVFGGVYYTLSKDDQYMEGLVKEK